MTPGDLPGQEDRNGAPRITRLPRSAGKRNSGRKKETVGHGVCFGPMGPILGKSEGPVKGPTPPSSAKTIRRPTGTRIGTSVVLLR